ncbi:cytochrome P450 4V2-like [Anthonomus grandis grandis]|uniref:cytochrome P450 4V2-like n=1 Tax=Anthonomus grandis grandis TaxID=2921223 RepID=UPI002166443F|nr:cytochrome P450 4V2-like [Anthonomus grandis grandis]
MFDTLVYFSLKCLLYFLVFTVIYNVFVLVTKFKYVRFAWNYNMFFLPLIPFVGTAYLTIFGKVRASMLQVVIVADKYFGGLPCNFWYGSAYHYLTNDADEARIILNHPKCFNKAELYKMINLGLRNPIVNVPVEIWKPRRHLLRPAFKKHMIKLSYQTYYQQSCLLLEEIKKLKPEDNLYKFFSKYAFMNFFLSSFGLSDAKKYRTDIIRIGTQIDAAQDEFIKIFSNPAIPSTLWKSSPFGAAFRAIENELKGLLKEVLEDYMEQTKKTSEYYENPAEKPLIELLLDEAYQKDPTADLFEEFAFITGAATDTSGRTLSFCFTMLGMYPEVQAKAYDEIQSVVGDRNIDFSDLVELKYVDAVISETLRILPTVPLFGRYCSEDIDLGSKIVPKGTNVFVSAYDLHRNPKYWEDPLKFDPERFLPENASKIVPGAYVPFSIGPRNCLGQTWGTVLLQMTIANVVRSFNISTSHKSIDQLALESCISMKTTHHLNCQFTVR